MRTYPIPDAGFDQDAFMRRYSLTVNDFQIAQIESSRVLVVDEALFSRPPVFDPPVPEPAREDVALDIAEQLLPDASAEEHAVLRERLLKLVNP